MKKWYTDRLINQALSTSVVVFAKKYSYKQLNRGLLKIFGPSTLARGANHVMYSSTDVIKFVSKFFY